MPRSRARQLPTRQRSPADDAGARRTRLLLWLGACALGAVDAQDTICVGISGSGLSANDFGCTTDRPASIQQALGGTATPAMGAAADTVLVFPGVYGGGAADDAVWWASVDPRPYAAPATALEDSRNINLNVLKVRSHVILKSISGPAATIISCARLTTGLNENFKTHREPAGCGVACPVNDANCVPPPACTSTQAAMPDQVKDGFGIQAANGETYETVIDGFTITKCGRAGRPGGGLRVLGGTTTRNFPETCSAINPGDALHVSHCSQVDLSGLDPEADRTGCVGTGGGGICQYYYGAGITVRNTWFLENLGSNGAAITVETQGHVVLERVIMRGNIATTDGGAIYADVGNYDGLVTNLVISDTLMVDNEAGARGGGMHTRLNVATCNIRITNSVISSNQAGTNGGGLDDPSTIGEYRMWNTIVASNTAANADSTQMFCGPNVNIISDQPSSTCIVVNGATGLCEGWEACIKGTGRSEPLSLSSYSSELAASAAGGMNSLVIGADKTVNSISRGIPLPLGSEQLPFYYGVPGQVWYLPPPALESCTAPVGQVIPACALVVRAVLDTPFTSSQCLSAHPNCLYTANQFRDPVTVTVNDMTLRPFRDMVEVLLIPKTTDSLADIFDVECYTRLDGGDYRGMQSFSRNAIACVPWDAHAPAEHRDRNTPTLNPFDGLEDGAFCRNPDEQAAPWCYLTQPTSTGQVIEACSLGQRVGACARDLDVMAKFTSNSTWEIFADYNQGVFIKLNLDEEYMTEGGLTLTLDYATSCTTAGCSGHGNCQGPEPGAPHVCICDAGYVGVDCATKKVVYTRTFGAHGGTAAADAINLQTALTLSAPNDKVAVAEGTYSGVGNYDIVLGNVNVTFSGAGPLLTIIDCQNQGRGFYIDSSVATGAIKVIIQSLTVTNCYANNSPVRGPIGGAAFIKHTVAEFNNVVMKNNRADNQGGAIYGFRSTIHLIDTVVGPGNIASIGGGLGLESTILVVNRAFVNDNIGTSLSALDGVLADNLNCFADSRVEYTRGFHWKELGKSILELETCSCCNGCQQAVPPLEVTQVTIDKELHENATLGEFATKVVIQGTFMSFGDDSVAASVYVAGRLCVLRNVTSYQIICGISQPYEAGQNVSVRRSDGKSADFPTIWGACAPLAEASCATVDATALTGQGDCPLAGGGGGACTYVPVVQGAGGHAAQCVPTDTAVCLAAVGAGASTACLAAGRCVYTPGPDVFPVYAERGVNMQLEAVAPLLDGQTSENNGRTKITLSLKSQPQAIVEIPVSVDFTLSAAAAAAGVAANFVPAVVETPVVYFTSANWDEPIQVVLSGQDDFKSMAIAHNYDVIIGTTTSMDINYENRERFTVPMSNMPFDCAKFGPFGYVPKQVGPRTTCVCDSGYEKNPIMLAEDMTLNRMDDIVPCTQCSNGKFKTESGNQACTLCPLTEKGDENYNIMDTANLMGQTTVDSCVCREGFAYDDSVKVNNTCIPCDELCLDRLGTVDKMKFFDPKDPLTWCVTCDSPGVKLSAITVREGWWRNARNSSHVYQCPSTSITGATIHCMEDAPTTSSHAANNTDHCLEGSHGVMCTGCSVQWAKLYTAKGGCLNCGGGGQAFIMAGSLLLLFGFMGATVYMSIQSAEDEDRTSTMLMKILISFTVTNIEVMKYRTQWPQSISSIFSAQKEFNSKTSFSMSDITSFDCFFASEPSEVRLWTKLVFYLALPGAAIVLPLLGVGPKWMYLKIRSRGMHPKAPEFLAASAGILVCREYMLAGVVVILYQVYPSTVNTAAAIFNCQEYEFDNKPHLSVEETVVCDGPEYEYWSGLAWIGLGGYGMGVPIILAVLLWSLMGEAKDEKGNTVMDEDGQPKLKMDDMSVSRKYGFLYGGFREECIWWEAVVLVRKLLFLLSATFLTKETTAFKIAVAMLITVTSMTYHLVKEPYLPEFASVSAMECAGMLTVFFTYGAVLMMELSLADKDREVVAGGGFTLREWLFYGIIIGVNMVFMGAVLVMVAWDIWRNTHKHIQEHGFKASVGHAKEAIKDKTKIDQIAKVIASPRDIRKTMSTVLGGDNQSFKEDSRRAVGLGLQHQLRKKKEEARKHEDAKMNWLRGLSGATAEARVSKVLVLGTAGKDRSVSREAQQAEVAASKNAVEKAETKARKRREYNSRHRESQAEAYDTEEVEALRRELAAAKDELSKARKGNIANRLRLGLRENKILQLQQGGGRSSGREVLHEPIGLDDIDHILATEHGNADEDSEQAKKRIAEIQFERAKVLGADGAKKVVKNKWETDGEPEAEPVAEPEPEPEPAPAAAAAAPDPEVDFSQMVGTKIFYGNSDREDAGKNAKQFLRAVQEVRNQGKKNSQLSDVIGKALAKDHSWFSETTSSVGVAPTPPTTGMPNTARSQASHAGAILAAGRQSAGRMGTGGVMDATREDRLDLEATEAALGLDSGGVKQLSHGEIDDQVEIWQRANRDAEVHALKTKMLMLGKFSAATLASTQKLRPETGESGISAGP